MDEVVHKALRMRLKLPYGVEESEGRAYDLRAAKENLLRNDGIKPISVGNSPNGVLALRFGAKRTPAVLSVFA